MFSRSSRLPLLPALAAAPGAADADIHDIHDFIPLTFWEQYLWHVVIGSVAGLLVLGLLLWLVFRKKPAPPLTPIEKARKELSAARLVPADQHKLFAIVVSDAVRRYLESAYKIPAPERTTEEFLQEMARHAWLQGKLAELLKRFLEYCDLAKFAGQQFGEAEREQLLAAAAEFVETAETLRTAPAQPKAGLSPVPAKNTDDDE